MQNILPGMKTYLVALGVVLVGVGGYFHGDLTAMAAVNQILAGLGLSALRIGIATTNGTTPPAGGSK